MTDIEKAELEIYLSKPIVKETWTKKNLPNLYSLLKDFDGETFSEKVYLFQNNSNTGKCKVCKSRTKFLSVTRGYRIYCSKSCSNNDPELIDQKNENFKKNFLEAWGVENPMQSEHFREKFFQKIKNLDYKSITEKNKQIFLEKWGVDNPSKLDWVKEKKAKTTMENWNVENPFQSEKIKEKIIQTNLEKWGVEHNSQIEEIAKKKIETNLKRYGVENPNQSPEIREKSKKVWLEKWGVDHPRKSEEINNKIKKKTIDAHNESFESIGSPIRVIDITDMFVVHCQKCFETSSIHKTTFAVRKRFDEIVCTNCNPLTANNSANEIALFEFISSLYSGEIIQNIKIEKKEIDIYLPELKLGFEFNGIYWHSSKFKDRNFHQMKEKHFDNLGIRLFQIWEDDWRYKKEIIKSMIKHRLGLSDKKIGARKCQVKMIEDNSIIRNFLEENHIQGFVGSKYKVGLFFENELVSLMTFGELRKSLGQKSQEGHWELLRFCNKLGYNIVGSASKLFKIFIENESPKQIISYSKNDYSSGDIYKILNFEYAGETSQNYYYVVGGKRINRFNFRKDKLIKEGFDPNLSEEKIMQSRGFFKIWDSGNKKWIWKQN